MTPCTAVKQQNRLPDLIHFQLLGSDGDPTPVVVYELQVDRDALRSGAPQIELKRTSDTADPQRVYDALYAEDIQEQLQSLAPRHDVRIRGPSDKVHTLETNVDIDLAAGETIGGRFAAESMRSNRSTTSSTGWSTTS